MSATDNQKWISGEFVELTNKKIVFKADGQEIELVSGMTLEATVGDGQTLVGRVGVRDDGLYFLGRLPMFAIPLKILRGSRGRVLSTESLKKTA